MATVDTQPDLDRISKQLSYQIWVTRKNHINASERLLKSAAYIEFINVYYSIVMILFSLLSISPYIGGNETPIAYLSIAASVILTVSIIFANSLGYHQRALDLKKNYISLQSLLTELDCLSPITTTELSRIQQEYSKLLSDVENHQHIDFINVKRTNHIDNHLMELSDWVYYYTYVLCHSFWRLFLVILPILALFIIYHF